MWLAHAHRTGRTKVLENAGNAAAFVLRVPGWAALPVVIATVGLLAAMWGGLWDIGYHVDNGRDTGPLGNPGHWPLLLGIFTTFAAGVIAFGMADQDDATPAWVRITDGWRVPIGAVLLVVCMSFGLSALALDDVWHRIFGQDVTLWSPTHFVFLFGGMLTVTGMLVLLKEGSLARTVAERALARRGPAVVARARLAATAARGAARRPSLRPRALPRRVRLGRPALPAGVAAAPARRFRRADLHGRARMGGARQRARRVGRLRAHPRDRDHRARPRGRVRALDAAAARLGPVRRAARAGARPAAARARLRRGRGPPVRDGRLRGRVRLVADRDAAALDRRPPARGPDLRGGRRRRRRAAGRALRNRHARRPSPSARRPHRLPRGVRSADRRVDRRREPRGPGRAGSDRAHGREVGPRPRGAGHGAAGSAGHR